VTLCRAREPDRARRRPVLTTGQEASVLEDDLITDLVERAAGNVIVMPGIPNSISGRNLRRIGATGIREMHTCAPLTLESRMAYRTRVSSWAVSCDPQYLLTTQLRIRELVRARRLAGQ
jgi:copper homeostasis protein CutC